VISAGLIFMIEAQFIELCRRSSGGQKSLPACEEGMVLLKKWCDTDAGVLALLPVVTDDLEQPL
jgi:hypothetical protein